MQKTGWTTKKTWLESVEADMVELEIDKEDVHDRSKWRRNVKTDKFLCCCQHLSLMTLKHYIKLDFFNHLTLVQEPTSTKIDYIIYIITNIKQIS